MGQTDEVHKNITKGERRVKELLFQQEENKKNQDRITDLVDKLQQKIKSYKKQIEEAEEIAAINLAKYRKAQQDFEEAEERSKLCEANIQRSFYDTWTHLNDVLKSGLECLY